MKEINFLKPTLDGRILDIGSYDGRNFPPLFELGYKVVAVEKSTKWADHIAKEYPLVELHQKDIADFEIKPDSFEAIICHNVLPFVESKEKVVKVILSCVKGLKKDGVFWFTVFGENDEWAKDITTFSYDEIIELLSQSDVKIIHKATEEGLGACMDGEIKNWQIHSFLIQRQ